MVGFCLCTRCVCGIHNNNPSIISLACMSEHTSTCFEASIPATMGEEAGDNLDRGWANTILNVLFECAN